MELSSEINNLASVCVKCGMCLPNCPTYQLSTNENHSPRGRIALMQALATKELEISTPVIQHLESCIGCLNCVKSCEAQVNYRELFIKSRILIKNHSYLRNFWAKLLQGIFKTPFLLAINFKLLRLAQKTQILNLLYQTKILSLFKLQNLYTLLPPLPPPINLHKVYPTTIVKPEIAIFTGCISKLINPEIITDTIKLLNFLGYGVMIPTNQQCCGGIANSIGDSKTYQNLAANNASAFASEDIKTILTIASGCGAELKQNPQIGTKVLDVMEFIADKLPKDVLFSPLDATVALHTPCSLQNNFNSTNLTIELLQRIPKIKLVTLPNNSCCGGAGSYIITQTQLAHSLRDKILQKCQEISPKYILTSNTGCYLQLQNANKLPINTPEIMHPLNLIVKQLALN